MKVTEAKTLTHGATTNASEDKKIIITGDPDSFQLLCKAINHSQNWMKSTKAMQINNVGCIVQTTTYEDGQVAEALVFVPGVKIAEDNVNGGKILVKDEKN